MSEEPVFIVETPEPGIRRLAFNDPARRNPLAAAAKSALIEAFEAALSDDTVRAIILTGRGGVFCAGGDVAAMGNSDEVSGQERMRVSHHLCRMIYLAEKPVIAAVEGPAFGAGAGLALLADTIVAGEGASIGFPFFKLGLTPDYGILHTLPKRVGHGAARQILLYARALKAKEASDAGLFDRIVPDADVQSEALSAARELAAQPRTAFAMAKRILNGEPQTFEQSLAAERTAQVMLFLTRDHAEGVKAFKEKRSAKFE
jgi:2-(1,2-epoxy-1,2-dihydrophenyl)acetyl-CoA isomerase